MIRKLFHGLALRERLLLVVFIWTLLVAWAFGLSSDLRAVYQRFDALGQRLRADREIVSREGETAQRLAEIRAGLDATKTVSATQLAGTLDTLARESNLDFDLRNAVTDRTDLMSFHSVRVGVRRAKLADLLAFEQKLRGHSPYISLEQFQITANRRDPTSLDAVFSIGSFELNEEALASAP